MTREEYLLICLIEECGEVIQACGKALRFGLDDEHQATNPEIVSPRLYLRKELNDVAAIAELFQQDWLNREMIDAKKAKLASFMDYSRTKGVLHD